MSVSSQLPTFLPSNWTGGLKLSSPTPIKAYRRVYQNYPLSLPVCSSRKECPLIQAKLRRRRYLQSWKKCCVRISMRTDRCSWAQRKRGSIESRWWMSEPPFILRRMISGITILIVSVSTSVSLFKQKDKSNDEIQGLKIQRDGLEKWISFLILFYKHHISSNKSTMIRSLLIITPKNKRRYHGNKRHSLP